VLGRSRLGELEAGEACMCTEGGWMCMCCGCVGCEGVACGYGVIGWIGISCGMGLNE
jgi:hypothetical protein